MKRAFIRTITVTVIAAMLMLAASLTVYAGPDQEFGPGMTWKQDEATGQWMFRKGSDYVRSDWLEVKGFWYLFDANGYMLTGWQEKDGAWYYLSQSQSDAHPLGSMYMNGLTPDGFYVSASGARVGGSSPVDPLIDPTVVEVNLTEQLVNLYVENNLILTTPCVTGRMTNDRRTPPGRFRIYSKETNRYLQGTNSDGSKYKSYVNYWMPFNGGIGLHDATWRGEFGGQIYVNNGSHGCINLPLASAATIFNVAYVGMPVIVHW